jgi:benzil reductase ((S)-benzoin forming)
LISALGRVWTCAFSITFKEIHAPQNSYKKIDLRAHRYCSQEKYRYVVHPISPRGCIERCSAFDPVFKPALEVTMHGIMACRPTSALTAASWFGTLYSLLGHRVRGAFDLPNKRVIMKAILTGHTRGLGPAIAADLLSRNIAVLGVSRNSNLELAKQYPTTLEQAEIDLSDSAALARWLAGDVLQHFVAGGKTVLLVNNAGSVQPVGSIDMQDVVTIAQAINLNVTAPLMLASAVAAASRDANDTRILHVSSGAGRNAYPGWSIYCATKAALDHHARAVVLDQTPNVRICSLAPGVIDTDMQAEIRATPLEQFPLRERFEGLKRDRQLSNPTDCARQVVEYLLSAQFGQVPVADLREVVK